MQRFQEQRERLIERLESLTRADERLVALWLQGSLADGSDDPLSDVDAYLAVRDEDFDVVYADRLALIGAVGTVLAFMDEPALRMVNCLLEGPVKLDLLFVPASLVLEQARPAVRMLVDKAGIGATLRVGWTPDAAAVTRIVERTIRGTLQGAAWPLRLLARGQWTTLAMTELELVNDFIVALLIAQLEPRHLFKNRFSIPRHLPQEQRRFIEELGAEVTTACAARDLAALQRVHLRILDAIYREGRLACAAIAIPYPISADAETAIRRLYLEHWPASP